MSGVGGGVGGTGVGDGVGDGEGAGVGDGVGDGVGTTHTISLEVVPIDSVPSVRSHCVQAVHAPVPTTALYRPVGHAIQDVSAVVLGS